MNGKQMFSFEGPPKKFQKPQFLPIVGPVLIPNYPVRHLIQRKKGAPNMLIRSTVFIDYIILHIILHSILHDQMFMVEHVLTTFGWPSGPWNYLLKTVILM